MKTSIFNIDNLAKELFGFDPIEVSWEETGEWHRELYRDRAKALVRNADKWILIRKDDK